MEKVIAILLALLMAASLMACGTSQPSTAEEVPQEAEQTQTSEDEAKQDVIYATPASTNKDNDYISVESIKMGKNPDALVIVIKMNELKDIQVGGATLLYVLYDKNGNSIKNSYGDAPNVSKDNINKTFTVSIYDPEISYEDVKEIILTDFEYFYGGASDKITLNQTFSFG